jgi:hypothetical protein
LWWREASRAAASPLPSASRMFIILAGLGGEPSWGPAFRMGWRPASSSGIRGRRASTSLVEEANFGRLQAPSAAACLAPRPGWLWCRLRRFLLLLGRGVAVRPPHGRWSRRAQVRHIHGFSRAAGRTGGLYKMSYAAGAATVFLDGLVLTPEVRTGATTSSRMLRQPPPTGAEVAAVVDAEVVAAAGEAARCRGGCLCWRDHQCHLSPSLQLFGFNGLIVTPRRKTGARTFSQWRTC